MNLFCKNLKQTLIALDQFIFCLLGSIISIFNHHVEVWADWTISAQAYRLEQKGYWYGKWLRAGIDMLFYLFEKDHCKLSYEAELKREHLPNDLNK